jgi:hypothetical protein
MKHPFESLPRRIFLDSCTAQTLRNYGGYIYEAEPIPASDRIHRVTEGIANVQALRDIFLVNERPHQQREAQERNNVRQVTISRLGLDCRPKRNDSDVHRRASSP